MGPCSCAACRRKKKREKLRQQLDKKALVDFIRKWMMRASLVVDDESGQGRQE